MRPSLPMRSVPETSCLAVFRDSGGVHDFQGFMLIFSRRSSFRPGIHDVTEGTEGTEGTARAACSKVFGVDRCRCAKGTISCMQTFVRVGFFQSRFRYCL